LDEKDVQVELANGVLAIAGEKKTEIEDKDRRFSERHYGRFERRIPVEDVDEASISAAFKNGVLTVTLPKVAPAQSKVKRHRNQQQIEKAGASRSRLSNSLKTHKCVL